MTITTADIKLMASARMTDESDGGGRMSGNALQDAAENNVFPDISSLNRARGALQFRKVFPAVLAAGTDTLLGAHVVLDDTPDDADVFSVIIPASGDAQDMAALATALNNPGTENFGYKGQTSLTATAAAAASTLSVAAVRAPLIPKSVSVTTEGGELASEEVSGATVVGWEPAGSLTLEVAAAGTASSGLVYVRLPVSARLGRVKPGSVAGTFTLGVTPVGGGATVNYTVTVTSDLDGSITATMPGLSTGVQPSLNRAQQEWTLSFGSIANNAVLSISSVSVTAELLVEVVLPRKTLRFTPDGIQSTFTLFIPAGVAINSVSFQYTTYASALQITVGPPTNGGGQANLIEGRTFTDLNSAGLVYSTGALYLVFQAPPRYGYDIIVYYADGGQTIPLTSGSLNSSGAIASGGASVAIAPGYVFGGATFGIGSGGEAPLKAIDGAIRNASGVIRGGVTPTGTISLPGNDGRSISGWYGVQRNPTVTVLSFDAPILANLQPATVAVTGTTALGASFSATANSSGVFSTAQVTGTYDSVTGSLRLTFSSGVNLYSLQYTALRNNPLASTADLQGLSEAAFSSDGTVPIIRVSDVVVLHHSADVAAATYANGNTVNCGRTNLASVRVIGSNGAGILTGWTVNLATGILTVVDISGWAQPVTVRHTIEHMAVVSGVPTAQSVLLNRPLTREFPSGSRLSSALVLGDLTGQVGVAFSQQTWTEVWSDSRIGGGISAQYQQLSNPITVSNIGAVNERWAIIFTTSSAFRVIGETLGQITTGDINSVLSPINPATGQPYFTLAALGWGGGWSAGNVLRFNTRGANYPVWVARVVRPSAPSSAPDSLTLAIRGDIDA